jgi:hypothetical protein
MNDSLSLSLSCAEMYAKQLGPCPQFLKHQVDENLYIVSILVYTW